VKNEIAYAIAKLKLYIFQKCLPYLPDLSRDRGVGDARSGSRSRSRTHRVVSCASCASPRSFLELQNSACHTSRLKQYWRGQAGVRFGLCTLDIYLRPSDTTALLLIRPRQLDRAYACMRVRACVCVHRECTRVFT